MRYENAKITGKELRSSFMFGGGMELGCSRLLSLTSSVLRRICFCLLGTLPDPTRLARVGEEGWTANGPRLTLLSRAQVAASGGHLRRERVREATLLAIQPDSPTRTSRVGSGQRKCSGSWLLLCLFISCAGAETAAAKEDAPGRRPLARSSFRATVPARGGSGARSPTARTSAS